MFDDYQNRDLQKKIAEEIVVLCRPCVGIISGYHELGYQIFGPEVEGRLGSVQISSRLHISPKLIWTPSEARKTFGDLFQEKELMDATLIGRVFAFPKVDAGHFNIENQHMKILHHEWSPDSLAERILRDIQKKEVTDTAVIRTPNIRFYPLAVQRFIHEILAEEFS